MIVYACVCDWVWVRGGNAGAVVNMHICLFVSGGVYVGAVIVLRIACAEIHWGGMMSVLVCGV
jgi:hypothetical protein